MLPFVWASCAITIAVLALLGGRRTQLAYALAIAFHVALVSFGWGFSLWSLPMVVALVTLLRAERRATEGVAGDSAAEVPALSR